MFSVRCLGLPRRVSPFRHPRIIAYLRLPAAFRSLSRLSSALSAKASSLRPSLLDLPFTPSVALLGGPQALAWAFPYWFGMASHASPRLSCLSRFANLIFFGCFFPVFGFQGAIMPPWLPYTDAMALAGLCQPPRSRASLPPGRWLTQPPTSLRALLFFCVPAATCSPMPSPA